MVRAKICGTTSAPDLDAAVGAGADAVGFVVDVPVDTPREITPEPAAELVARVPPFVSAVLVTMPEGDLDGTADLVARIGPDAVQLHGEPSPDAVARLRERTGVRVVPAIDGGDIEAARRYEGVADALLVDTPAPDGGGGTGRTHDWEATREVVEAASLPVVLAGGLAPGNVVDAIDAVDPYAVDVASGVESKGGRKDHDAVERFVARATGVTS